MRVVIGLGNFATASKPHENVQGSAQTKNLVGEVRHARHGRYQRLVLHGCTFSLRQCSNAPTYSSGASKPFRRNLTEHRHVK